MKVADYVINFLADKGIDKIFVVYGAANGDLIDAFTRTDKTEYVCLMHEQAAGFAAEGYAKVSGRPGAVIATSGPGGQNLITPIANCYFDSVPCIFITGQVPTYVMKKENVRQVGFQETDICKIADPITKASVLLDNPEDTCDTLDHLWHVATTGRPGPVLLDIPLDVQKAKAELIERPRGDWRFIDHDISELFDGVSGFLTDLSSAKRPVMIVGGGCRNAISEFRRAATILGIPCFPTWNAIDIVTSDFEYYGGRIGTYGGAGRNFGIQNSDLMLIVGCRLSGRVTGGSQAQIDAFAPNAKKYLVDIDENFLSQLTQRVMADVNIRCDAKVFFDELVRCARSQSLNYDVSGWVDQVMKWKKQYDPVRDDFPEGHPYRFMRTLSELAGKDDVIVGDCGGNIVILSQAFETKYGQRVFTNNGNSPMGFSFAAAIGAWFAKPKGRVICIIGDGGFNMNIQELQTVVNYGIDIKTFILNNHAYGITKQFQETNFEGRYEACGPKGYKPPDFLEVVAAYGIEAFRMSDANDFNSEDIACVLNNDGPTICEVDIGDFHTYEPRISNWNDPIHDMYPKLPKDELERNML